MPTLDEMSLVYEKVSAIRTALAHPAEEAVVGEAERRRGDARARLVGSLLGVPKVDGDYLDAIQVVAALDGYLYEYGVRATRAAPPDERRPDVTQGKPVVVINRAGPPVRPSAQSYPRKCPTCRSATRGTRVLIYSDGGCRGGSHEACRDSWHDEKDSGSAASVGTAQVEHREPDVGNPGNAGSSAADPLSAARERVVEAAKAHLTASRTPFAFRKDEKGYCASEACEQREFALVNLSAAVDALLDYERAVEEAK